MAFSDEGLTKFIPESFLPTLNLKMRLIFNLKVLGLIINVLKESSLSVTKIKVKNKIKNKSQK
jgi:hypothetical protein